MALDGKTLVLKLGGALVTAQLTGSLTFTADALDATTKDSNGWKEFISGERNANIEVTGLYEPAGAENVSEAVGYIFDGSEITWYFGGTTAGDTYWTGSGIITNVAIQGDKSALSSYSFSIQNSGAPQELTVSAS